MKIKYFFVLFSLFIFIITTSFPKNGEAGCQTSYTIKNGQREETVSCTSPEEMDAYVKKHQADQKQAASQQQKEQQAAARTPIQGEPTSKDWNTSGQHGQYQEGTAEINQEWLKNQKQAVSDQTLQQMSQIGQAAGQVTKDPRTASLVTGTTSTIAGVGTGINAARQWSLSSEYQNAINKNNAAITANKAQEAKISTNITNLQKKLAANPNDKNIQAEIDALKNQGKQIASERQAQEQLVSEQKSARNSARLSSGASYLGAAAMIGSGVMNAEMGRKLASENARCRENPKALGCSGENPNLASPTDPFQQNQNQHPDQSIEGFKGLEGDNNAALQAAGANGGSGAGSGNLASSGNSKANEAFKADFGSGNSAAGSPSGTADDSKLGYTPDMTYGSGGGSASGQDSGSLVSMSFGPEGSPGFDINQFLPPGLQDQSMDQSITFQDLGAAREPAKQTILLDKNSPSLFTRITKAHQKKAHEFVQEALF